MLLSCRAADSVEVGSQPLPPCPPAESTLTLTAMMLSAGISVESQRVAGGGCSFRGVEEPSGPQAPSGLCLLCPSALCGSNIDLSRSLFSAAQWPGALNTRVYLIRPGMQCNYKQFVFSVVKYGLEEERRSVGISIVMYCTGRRGERALRCAGLEVVPGGAEP